MIYLASGSPQRSKLLFDAGIPFEVLGSDGDEDAIHIPHVMAMALERARVKAQGARIAHLMPDWPGQGVILAADTIVNVGDQILGKPKDADDARRMLQALSGTRHKVVTGQCCLIPAHNGQEMREASFVSFAYITMRPLSDQDIDAYLDTGESSDRSGGYAIQETADQFVVDREGEHDAVVGLSVTAVRRLYHELTGEHLPEPEAEV
ncbi:MAG: Maf family protein [Planctomycetota bacterium]|nr:Maf family protein [Planctomycetota bacterium]